MPAIQTILIANRGEIARRIIRTCREMGIRSVAVYSEADREAPFVREADAAVALRGRSAAESYLDAEQLLAAARRTGADAVHPGYGFLAENAAFARRCAEAGLTFIGPHPEAIEQMGSKSRAKDLMESHGVPVIPGYRGEDQSEATLRREAERIGYPVLLKAAAGGGGKGMRIVNGPDELKAAIQAARREARGSFGDDELLLEKYFPRARHIEFQIFGDRHGNALHLLERECSLQRRYQKVVEESPSPVLTEAERKKMGEAAVRAALALNYDNAGTVEFIYVGEGKFYFLEVNTRLQVEHPVTEMITGLDLVRWQIEIAEGAPLPLRQEEIRANGYALECRLYAEDARDGFLPVTGRILQWDPAPGAGLRYDAAIESGSEISIYYDPMIAKVIAHGPDRGGALRRMRYALDRLVCLGLTTNLPFLQFLLGQADFRQGQYDTRYIERALDLSGLYDFSTETHHRAAVALTLFRWAQRRGEQPLLPHLPSGWRNSFYQPQEEQFRIVDSEWTVHYRQKGTTFEIKIGEAEYDVRLIEAGPAAVTFEMDGLRLSVPLARRDDWYFLHLPEAGQLIARALPRFPEADRGGVAGGYQAPMPGEVVEILVQPGEAVTKGAGLIVLASMKMENTITAAEDGKVEEVLVAQGQQVEAGTLLLKLNTGNGEATGSS